MYPASQVIVRNQAEFNHSNVVVVNPFIDALPQELEVNFACVAIRQQQLNHFEQSTAFDQLTQKDRNCTWVLVIPKAKQLQLMLLDLILSVFLTGDELFVIGENDSGGKSIGKLFGSKVDHIEKIDSARHCQLYQLHPHSKAPKFSINQHWQTFAALDNQFHHLPGVFSAGRLDKATNMLLTYLKDRTNLISGNLLDFGCGCGVIGLTLSKAAKKVTCIDNDLLAIKSTEYNIQQQNIANVNVLANDGLEGIDQTFDTILSNPPFHQGKRTVYGIAQLFLEQACNYLKPNGMLIIVANSFLEYEPIIETNFQIVEVIRENGFKIIKAQKR